MLVILKWFANNKFNCPHLTHNIRAVTNLRTVNTTTSSITITWDQPPSNYTAFLQGEATDNIPQSRVIHQVNVTGQSTHTVEGLNSFRNYSIGVYLKSNLGQGSNATVTFQTLGRGETAESTLKCLCECHLGAYLHAESGVSLTQKLNYTAACNTYCMYSIPNFLPTYTPHSTKWNPHPPHCHSHKQVSHPAVESTTCTQ